MDWKCNNSIFGLITLQVERVRMNAEFEKIQKIADADERQAAVARLMIVDNLLVLRCPRCTAVFADFDGCFALKCHRNACGAAFCAWCLQDCGADAHAHVQTCAQGNGRGYYGTKEEFEEHHRLRRRRLVLEKIGEQRPEVQVILKRLLVHDLRDLDIQLENELKPGENNNQLENENNRGGNGIWQFIGFR